MDIRNFFGGGKQPQSKVKTSPATTGNRKGNDKKKSSSITLEIDDSDSTTENKLLTAQIPKRKRNARLTRSEASKTVTEQVNVSTETFLTSSSSSAKKSTTIKGANKSNQRDSSDDHDECQEIKRTVKRAKKIIIDDPDDDSDDDPSFSLPKTNSRAKSYIPTTTASQKTKKDDSFEEDCSSKDTNPKLKKRSPANTSPTKKIATRKVATTKKAAQQKRKPILPTLKIASFDTDQSVPECMAGWTFVFTGVLEGLSREDSVDLVKTLGGRVTAAVSGKTDYLVVGEVLEDGRAFTEGSKYIKALELSHITIVRGVDELFGLCKLYNDQARIVRGLSPMATPETTTESQSSSVEKSKATDVTSKSQQESQATTVSATSSILNAKKSPINPYKKTPVNPYSSAGVSKINPYAKSEKSFPDVSTVSAVAATGLSGRPIDNSRLWADKHAPKNTREILGNAEAVKKLVTCMCLCLILGGFRLYCGTDCIFFLSQGLTNGNIPSITPKLRVRHIRRQVVHGKLLCCRVLLESAKRRQPTSLRWRPAGIFWSTMLPMFAPRRHYPAQWVM